VYWRLWNTPLILWHRNVVSIKYEYVRNMLARTRTFYPILFQYLMFIQILKSITLLNVGFIQGNQILHHR